MLFQVFGHEPAVAVFRVWLAAQQHGALFEVARVEEALHLALGQQAEELALVLRPRVLVLAVGVEDVSGRSEARLVNKFELMAKRVLSDERAAQVLMLCRRVADLGDVGEVGRVAAL